MVAFASLQPGLFAVPAVQVPAAQAVAAVMVAIAQQQATAVIGAGGEPASARAEIALLAGFQLHAVGKQIAALAPLQAATTRVGEFR